jgi:hypothetical protein
MRSTNDAPLPRASSQLNSAVPRVAEMKVPGRARERT